MVYSVDVASSPFERSFESVMLRKVKLPVKARQAAEPSACCAKGKLDSQFARAYGLRLTRETVSAIQKKEAHLFW
jgi:hypothetical protein